jgi:hypothetical protein
MKSDLVPARFCDRCKEMKPIEEWKYRPWAYSGRGGWEHIGESKTEAPGPCGWCVRVPQAIERE